MMQRFKPACAIFSLAAASCVQPGVEARLHKLQPCAVIQESGECPVGDTLDTTGGDSSGTGSSTGATDTSDSTGDSTGAATWGETWSATSTGSEPEETTGPMATDSGDATDGAGTDGESDGGTGGGTGGESDGGTGESDGGTGVGTGSESDGGTGGGTGESDGGTGGGTGESDGGTGESDGDDAGGGDTDGESGGDTDGESDGDDTGGGDDGGGPSTGGGDDGGGGACPTRSVRAPRVTTTAHIAAFDPLATSLWLLTQQPWQTLNSLDPQPPAYAVALTGLVTGLAVSANPDPPPSFSNTVYGNMWGPWKNSQEYRGFLDIFPYKIRCDAGANTLVKEPGTAGNSIFDYVEDATMASSLGFTRLPGPFFQAAEPHGTTPLVNQIFSGDRSGGRKNACVTYHGYYASRVGAAERLASFAVLQYDAPFIWQDVHSTVCCDGTYDVHVKASHFPTQSVYLNFERMVIGWQTNLAQFLISGGVDYNPPGVGLMAAAGPVRHYTDKAKVTDDCTGAVVQDYAPKPPVSTP